MKAGVRNYNGVLVPEHAKICQDKNSDEFYVSCIKNDSGIWVATIKYILTDTFKNVSFNIIEKDLYLNK